MTSIKISTFYQFFLICFNIIEFFWTEIYMYTKFKYLHSTRFVKTFSTFYKSIFGQIYILQNTPLPWTTFLAVWCQNLKSIAKKTTEL